MSNGSSITHCLLLPFADIQELQLWHFWLFLGISLGNGLTITSTACNQHLHIHAYVFLFNFSLLDLGCIFTAVPRSMANSLWDTRAISYTACAAQFFFSLFLS
ncbi:Olfactory receptor 14I1 [Amazona aestiva]|uniref:Olfactory receptor 14I1 n=1 Tax=Amazona aestiva TaxID=12930 RepID=A0A0Q3WE50_AMAAE|nr:Olfactory receptor 14I1 [Amazona aestiva]